MGSRLPIESIDEWRRLIIPQDKGMKITTVWGEGERG